MTTLVLSNHTPVIEEALFEAGKEVVVCLTEPAARLRMATRPTYDILTVSHWAAYDELATLATQLRGRVDHVATVWEGAIPAAGFLRDLLDLPGQSMNEALGFTDKATMKDRLVRGGVPAPVYRLVRSVADIHRTAAEVGGYPVVVKPLLGFGSTNTHIVHGFGELQKLRDQLFSRHLDSTDMFAAEPAFKPLEQHTHFLVEEFVDIREEYHCDGFWIDGEPIYHIPGRYMVPPLLGMGGTLGSVLLDPDDGPGAMVAALAERAARTLRMRDGFTHAEIYHDSRGRWLLGEIAARPGGGGIQSALGHAYGIDVPLMLGQLAAGEPVEVQPVRRPGVYGWSGPAVPPGRVRSIVTRDSLLRFKGVLDATVVATPGSNGGPTGTGLWGGLAGYMWFRGNSIGEVLSMMDTVGEKYAIEVDQPLVVAP